MNTEEEKRLAADAAAELIEANSRVGLGTGTTVAYLLEAIARRGVTARYVATSPGPRTPPVPSHRRRVLRRLDELDLAIDGADQIAPDGWLVKGRGGAHLREKVVAASARRFVSSPTPRSQWRHCIHRCPWNCITSACEPHCENSAPSPCGDAERSPDGGVLADYHGA